MASPWARVLAAAAASAVAALCAGCSIGLGPATSTTTQAAERLARNVDAASSAVGTAELAVHQLRASRTFATVAETTLQECGGQLSAASAGLTRGPGSAAGPPPSPRTPAAAGADPAVRAAALT